MTHIWLGTEDILVNGHCALKQNVSIVVEHSILLLLVNIRKGGEECSDPEFYGTLYQKLREFVVKSFVLIALTMRISFLGSTGFRFVNPEGSEAYK